VVDLFLKYVGFEIDITGEKWWGMLLMPPTTMQLSASTLFNDVRK